MIKTYLIIAALILLLLSSVAADDLHSFLGHWEGSIRLMDQRIDFYVDIIEDGEEVKGYMSIPLQMMRDHPLNNVSIDYPNISFELTSGGVTAYFMGDISNNIIEGTLRQEGAHGSFELVKGEKVETPEPEPIQGETEVGIETYYESIYGSLVEPERNDDVPLVIIIPGSGPTDRDGNNPMSGEGYVYRDLALELKENGFASLRFDKRGVGASQTAIVKEEDLRFDYFVRDVIHMIDNMRERGFESIILLGHSEGSLIGIMAAQAREIDAFISVAGMGRSMGDVLIEQMSRQPDPYGEEAAKIVESLREGALVQDVSEELKAVFRPEIQPYLLSMMRHNPVEEIGELDVPILILQGSNDIQINVEDAQLLHEANKKSQMTIFDGMNHMMRDSSEDLQETLKTYRTPGLPFSDGFIDTIISFIDEL